jgi:Tol biopolymer transport system component
MLADGSNVTQLTDGVSEEEPAWSPDGTQIIFRSYRDGNGEIYVANADGSAPTNLTLDAANDDAPHWR